MLNSVDNNPDAMPVCPDRVCPGEPPPRGPRIWICRAPIRAQTNPRREMESSPGLAKGSPLVDNLTRRYRHEDHDTGCVETDGAVDEAWE